MRKFLILLEREMKSYFYSPIAYVVLFLFLVLAGFNAYLLIRALSGIPVDISFFEAFFLDGFFWFMFLPLVPLITMRLYSEEFKSGTIETLMTAPVSDLQVVMSKFAAALLFYLVLWLPTALYFVAFELVTKAPASPTVGPYFSLYLILLLMGMLYLSLGCLASVVTRNQIIAAFLCLVLVLIVFFAGTLGGWPGLKPTIRDWISQVSTVQHLQNYGRGLVDTGSIVFYLTATAFLQLLTFHVFQYRKWKS